MKRSLLTIGILLVLFLIIVFGGILLLNGRNNTNTATNSTTTFPLSGENSSSGTNTSGTASSSATPTMTIPLQDGSMIATRDFINNGITTEDPENKGTYYLAGSIGYCNTDGTCPSGATSTDYHVVYFAQDKAFIISLIQEPIGQSRKEAEQFLMQTLGISQDQMCSLKYSVLTTTSVNSTYAGENLGFSFCPGAVALP